jgi:DNA-binding transcriptional regulator YhcF (GntR family)
MTSPYRRSVLERILEDNKRLWSIAEFGGDADLFLSRVVEPLRELKREGVIVTLSEIVATIGGKVMVIGVEVIGPIPHRREDEE